MNIKEAATYLRLNYMTVYKLAQKRRIPAFKVRGQLGVLNGTYWIIWLTASGLNTHMGSVPGPCDDESDIRDILKEIIKDQHHDVTTAESGETALDEIKKHHLM